MADKPPLVARWGGSPPPTHPPLIITNPASSQSDLTLTSEVLVQSFLSLQKHQYTYRIDNGLKTHVLRVDWKDRNQNRSRRQERKRNQSRVVFLPAGVKGRSIRRSNRR